MCHIDFTLDRIKILGRVALKWGFFTNSLNDKVQHATVFSVVAHAKNFTVYANVGILELDPAIIFWDPYVSEFTVRKKYIDRVVVGNVLLRTENISNLEATNVRLLALGLLN